MIPQKNEKIVYYTHVYFLDIALEYVRLLADYYQVFLFIEISPESKKANILDLNVDLNNYDAVVNYSSVEREWGIESLNPYFQKCVNVNFVVHKSKQSLSPISLLTAFILSKKIKDINPAFIHFDGISLRALGLIPFLIKNRSKLLLNVHDPKFHSGEKSLKAAFFKKIYYPIFKRYVVFSEYSKAQLSVVLDNKEIYTIKLLPYTFYRNFIKISNVNPEYITFVGRISPYKGINLFLESMKDLKNDISNLKFCIAGKSINNFQINENMIKENNVKYIDKHLNNEEMTRIILNSKLIVCPYLDATQSGVLMTAYALNRPVIATPVGGFPEYIKPSSDFITKDVSAKSLKDAIVNFINKDECNLMDSHIDKAGEYYNISQYKYLYNN